MTATISRFVGWMLGTLIILVPVAVLLLIAGLVLKIAVATFGAVAVIVVITGLLLAVSLLKAVADKQ